MNLSMDDHHILPSFSGSMSPMSIAIKSSDIRRSRDCSGMRKHVLLARARSNSIDLVDHDYHCSLPPAIKKGDAKSPLNSSVYSGSSNFTRPTPLSIPSFEEEDHKFFRQGNMFIHIETRDNASDEISFWPPVSPTDLEISSPNLVLKDQYRRRFFQKSGFNLLSELRTPTSKIGEVQK